MWIFALGETLKRATLTSHVATSRLSSELCRVLTDMTRSQATSRASLMYLLDVSMKIYNENSSRVIRKDLSFHINFIDQKNALQFELKMNITYF